ncbi:ABC transporter ATP-binding protein [candidate division WWE3 bacterium]|uniref:ABC transporter ATP-binding protein n=1 Tax=candidate division WWE3 bacterium TaxID=2053526 RepID=A0A3A4ZEW9_UNCKA|nr:MAG: ABC transporter ATP-binding protein [candidate division WWE3 bacterium]
MSDIAIRVENLSKRYRIGQREPYRALRDVLARGLTAPFRATTSAFRRSAATAANLSGTNNHIWALKDVSFDVKRGEVVGIIGRNGAGKSTLLKILSRITEPTEGYAEIHGRVGSLLEVGTGFHPELTGRENIYLNGAILGMKKYEIERKFDEIVDFAEIEKFIDTPVKYYSSGMYVRLAFTVAAHLEPEILLVDEVLAVGDAAFQKKCLGKMGDVAKEGRTVLFVSHNMGAISNLTRHCLWLDNGILREEGPTMDIVSHYLEEGYKKITKWQTPSLNNKPIQIIQAEIVSESGYFDVKSNFKINIEYIVREPVYGAVVSAIIHVSDGASILGTEDIDTNPELLERRNPGKYRATVDIPGNWLSPRKYFLRLHSGVVFQSIFDNIEALSFELIETGNPKIRAHKQAYLLPYLDWDIKKLS